MQTMFYIIFGIVGLVNTGNDPIPFMGHCDLYFIFHGLVISPKISNTV